MLPKAGFTTERILAVFTEAIAAHRGHVTETFDDGRRLLVRSVLPRVEEVRSGDQVKGGVALKATEEEIWLYPYVFRLVCRNGAIMAQTLETQCHVNLQWCDADEAEQSIREGVEAVCAEEVFATNVCQMRNACDKQADLALTMMPLLARISAHSNSQVLSQVMDQFFQNGDSSLFGLANAVTATARETRDPELRWDLEEYGGSIAIGLLPKQPVDRERRAEARPRQLASVG